MVVLRSSMRGWVFNVMAALAVVSSLSSTACRKVSADPAGRAVETASPPVEASGVERPVVVFLGDSLTAGLGLPEDRTYPALLEGRLARENTPVRVVNAGVSGDTTAGGLTRLAWLLRQKPSVVVVGLGANDALRGLPLEMTERNLREIIGQARASGAAVLLLGMRIPPNYGDAYAGAFDKLYSRIARELAVPLVPFLLEGVGGHPELNLADGLHPSERGHEIVATNVYPFLAALLRDLPARRTRTSSKTPLGSPR